MLFVVMDFLKSPFKCNEDRSDMEPLLLGASLLISSSSSFNYEELGGASTTIFVKEGSVSIVLGVDSPSVSVRCTFN